MMVVDKYWVNNRNVQGECIRRAAAAAVSVLGGVFACVVAANGTEAQRIGVPPKFPPDALSFS